MSEFEQHEYTFESSEPQHESNATAAPKKRGAWRVIAIVLAAAILGGVAGGAVTRYITPAPVSEAPAQAQPTFAAQESTAAVVKTADTNSTGKSLSPAEVYEQNVGAVCGIKTQVTTNVFGQVSSSAVSGSGFVLTENGYVVTNAHVIENATAIQVTLQNGETYDAKLVGSYAANDVALLKVEASGLQHVTVGCSSDLVVGEMVAAIGNPLGELTNSMTVGYISALDREINTDGTPINMLQTDAAINSGNSGGPLFDMNGNVVAITSAKYSGRTSSGAYIEGICFCIPIDDVMDMISDLQVYGRVTGVAYLGVSLRDLDKSTSELYHLPVGPYVMSVAEGSCAQRAGVQDGDIILALGDVEVQDFSQLSAAMKKHRAGDATTLTVYRAGERLTIDVVLDEAPTESVSEQVPQEPQAQPQHPEAAATTSARPFPSATSPASTKPTKR